MALRRGLRRVRVKGRDLFDLAAGGTLLLDGIDHLPIDVQAGLARSLRDRRVASAAALVVPDSRGAHHCDQPSAISIGSWRTDASTRTCSCSSAS